MPIYAYRCSSCGHAKDVLQKMSDPVLTTTACLAVSTVEAPFSGVTVTSRSPVMRP